MVMDLKWWLSTLSVGCLTRTLMPWGLVHDLSIFIDASTSWGIGIIISGHWAAFHLTEDWKVAGRDICWLETLAIEFLTYFLKDMGLRNAHLLIHSDNQGAIGALNKGCSQNYHINLSVHHTYTVLSSFLITPQFLYIASKANLADPTSHRELGPPDKQLPTNFKLPEELHHCFTNV
jgi:hypothetical protein